MNTTTRRIFTAATITAAAAGIGLTTAPASAQPTPYDRIIRSQDITFTASSIPNTEDITIRPNFTNQTPNTLNLSGTVTIEVRGPHHDPLFFVDNIVQTDVNGQFQSHCGDPGDNFCHEPCVGFTARCTLINGSACQCIVISDIVFPHITLTGGDMVTASIFPAADSMPELDTSNDSATVTFQSTACPADINGDGGIDVRDYLAFLSLYAAADPRADFNASGHIDVADYLAFLSAYAVGCN
jgi:hypothetical protein